MRGKVLNGQKEALKKQKEWEECVALEWAGRMGRSTIGGEMFRS